VLALIIVFKFASGGKHRSRNILYITITLFVLIPATIANVNILFDNSEGILTSATVTDTGIAQLSGNARLLSQFEIFEMYHIKIITEDGAERKINVSRETFEHFNELLKSGHVEITISIKQGVLGISYISE
jgi:hypothetical protein